MFVGHMLCFYFVESINVILTDGAETNCGGNVNVMGTVVPLPTYEHWFP